MRLSGLQNHLHRKVSNMGRSFRGLQQGSCNKGGSQRLGVAHMGDKDPYLKGWRNGASVASSGHYPPKSDCCCSWQPNSRRRAAIMLQPARNASRVRCRAVVTG